ncbi:MAG: hypothetical protein KAT34_14040 [Candidatus Aminicenantes bacterium]|nr:hypothetical protein [Candidatus Aminicenantes bacterium]
MKNFLSFLSVIVILSILLSSPGCKKWEGRYYIYSAACETRYYQSTNESKFAVGIEIANEESKGIGAIFADWDFEIYDGDEELLLKINRSNYDTLEFLITVFAETPIPDRAYRGYPGLLNVLTGRGTDAWRIVGDIFNGKTPKKLKYTLTLLDDNNYVSTLSGVLKIMHVTD